MSQEVSAPARSKKPVKKQWKPTFQGGVEYVSHLFKLMDAKMLKKIVMGRDESTVQEATHNHFFHTQDSSGRLMEHSASVGGHFHVMTVSIDPETGEPKATCSGPKTFVHKKNGRKVLADLPAFGEDEKGEPILDRHTHEVVYKVSSKVRPRTVNAESVMLLNQEAMKVAPVDGIKG